MHLRILRRYNMKKLVVLLMVSLMATSAFAVVDPDPDMMGVYFDLNADTHCTSAGVNIPFFAYFCVTNPSAAAIDAYEFGYVMDVPVGFEGLIFRLATTIANGASQGVDVGVSGPLGGDVIVGLATPLPGGEVVVVHAMQYMLLADMTVPVYLSASSSPSLPGGLPVIQEAGGELMTVGTSTGGPDIPVAMINDDGTMCPVAVEADTWGGLKSLYR
jgi:hypothetical protein